MTPEQLAARLEAQGDKLTAQAVRDILRTFRDVDTRLLLTQILSAMQAQSPTQRLASREQLLAIARSLYPSLPDSLTALTAQAASAGAQAGAGMILQAAPFVQPAVLEVAGEAAARLRGFWGASAEDYAGRVGSILTRALSSGGRYPVTREIQNALSVSRQRAQLIGQNEIAAAATGGQYRVAQKASEELGAPVLVTWRSAGDRRVRASHRSLSGKTVKQGQSFKAGMTLRYPHDPAAPASETVRCRCALIYSMPD